MPTTNILDLNNRIEQLEKSGGGSGGGGAADDVTYDPTASGLQATNVQDAIDEVASDLSGLSADDVTYDNTDSGLSSDTVQGAIDETVNKIDTLTAGDVGYDNTTSGLVATTVQAAIDEVAATSGGVNYSTTEHVIGTWIDGATLYEKTVDFGTLPNAGTKDISSGLSNVNIISITGIATGGGFVLPLPYAVPSGANTDISLNYNATGNYITIIDGYNWSDRTAYVTLRYTKNS